MKRNQVICRAALNTSVILMTTFACETLTNRTANGVTLADWTFETTQPVATVGANTASAQYASEAGLNASSSFALALHATGTTYSTPVGNGSAHSFSSNMWSVGDYYEFETPTTGYQSISVQWDQTSSNTGPGQFELEYSTNGSTFTPYLGTITSNNGASSFTLTAGSPNYTLSPGGSFSSGTVNPLYTYIPSTAVSSSLDNQANVYFRIVDNSTVAEGSAATAATSAVATAGTDRVDNFIISGSAISAQGPAVTWTNAANDNTWNTTSIDWTGTSGPTAYADTDQVTFPDGKQGTVTIATGGVQPYSTTVSNNSGTYTLASSDSIGLGGNGTVTMNGTGKLVLTGTNTYVGGTIVNAGTLSIDSDAELGNDSGPLTINGGSLLLTGSPTLARSLVVGANGATINTNGQNAIIGAATGNNVTGTGNLVKIGSGNLTFNASIATSFAGTISVLGSTGSSSVTFNAGGGNDFAAPTTHNNFTGDLRLANAGLTLFIRGGNVDGGGTIYIQGNGPWIEGNAPVGSSGGATTTIGNNIITNAFGDFGVGATTGSTLVINSTISGPASLYFVAAGTVQLGNNGNSYQAPTVIDNSNSTGPTVNAGVAQLGADNVLNINNELHFGDPFTTGLYNNSGVLDLNGHNQTVFALATYNGPVTSSTTGGNTNSQFAPSNGISNSTSTVSTLTIDDQGNGDSTIYANPIGAVTTKNFTGTDKIALTLAPSETGELTLVNASTYSGATTINGGTLALSTGITGYTTVTTPTTTFTPVFTTGSIANSPVTVGAAGTLLVAVNTGASVGALNATSSSAQVQLGDSVLTITGNGGLNSAFDGTISTNAKTGGLAVTGGTLQLSGATHHLGTLSITSTGKVDLTNSNLIVDDTSGSTAALVADLKSGSLFTSNAISGGHLTGLTLGYLDTGSVLDIKYTWYGDTNLDGKVNGTDLTAMSGAGGSTWTTGDLNYDGVKNADDWSLFELGVAAYNGNTGLISAGVPEPTSLALIGLPVVMGLRRRRR